MAEATVSDRSDIQHSILRERLRLIHEQVPRSVPLIVLAVTAMALLGGQSLPLWAVAVWWLAMVGLALLRLATVRGYRRAGDDVATQRYWARVTAGTVTAAGVGWGLGSVLLAYGAGLEYQLLVLMVIAGIALGALPSLSLHLPSFVGFILAIALPNLAWLLWQGGRVEVVSGLLLGVYVAALLYNARRVSALMDQTLGLRFENEAMARSLMDEKDELQAMNAELERLSHIDGLTGLANRRYFDARFEEQWQRGMRENASVAVLMLDIDEFKRYNDAYGHTAGDECLRRVANCIARTLLRPSDLAARYGGEEFVVLLANTSLEGAANVAQEILRSVRELGIAHLSSPVAPVVTVSIGISALVPNRDIPRAYLIESADLALYRAKHAGRNGVAEHYIEDPKQRIRSVEG